MTKKVIIIGAGFGGLSAAALLANKGYDVTVLEKNSSHGGRGRVWKEKGFIFDMGPSWYLMNDVFEKFFEELGEKPENYYKLKRLDPAYRIFFGNNKQLDIRADINKNRETFEKLEKGGAKKFDEYLKKSEYQYNIAMKDFIYKEYNKLTDMFSLKMLVEGSKLHVFENMDRYTKRYFNNSEARKILEYTLVFLGGSPKNTPAMYNIMSHIDFNMGVWYPDGGISAVADAIYKIAKKKGVKFKFDEPVEQIITENGKATTVKTNKALYKADIVISNADYAHTELKLLDQKSRTYDKKYWAKRVYAPSAFIIYLGIKGKIKSLTHHNLFFENDWQKHFDEIFNNPKWPKEPSYYISCPSKTDKKVAPKGHENIFVLVPVAPGLKDDEVTREEYYNKTMTHIENLLGEKIRDKIVVKRIYSHRDFYNDYNAYKGTALGLSHTLMQTAVLRPRQKSRKVKNLYYTGQYTHPGIGVPMVIISSQILANNVFK